MSHTRRDFIKFVVAGSVASGCPIDQALLADPSANPPSAAVEGEHFATCHQVRDGHSFPKPDATRKVDIVIVGGGMAGLSAAYFLRGKDWLLLEKEDHFGGNAYQEEFAGQPYSTAAAYDFRGSYSDQLAKEIGLELLPVDMPDPTIDNGVYTPDTWNSRPRPSPLYQRHHRQLPEIPRRHPENEPAQGHARARLQALHRNHRRLRSRNHQVVGRVRPFQLGRLHRRHHRLHRLFPMRNISSRARTPRACILPGGLGCITHKLVEVMKPQYGERMLGGATVVSVVPDANEVRVTYMHGDKLTTVSAKVVLMCSPKFITSRLVAGLPDDQKQAMRRMRYAPVPMINMIFDKPIYRKGYDNWCPGNSFTDFIVADWTIRNHPGYKPKYKILTFYTPLRESERATLLEDEDCKAIRRQGSKGFSEVPARIQRRSHRDSPLPPRACHDDGRSRPVHKKPHDRVSPNGSHLLRQLRFRRPRISHHRSRPHLPRRRRMGQLNPRWQHSRRCRPGPQSPNRSRLLTWSAAAELPPLRSQPGFHN